MTKKEVIYDRYDPNQEGVTHVAIDLSNPQHVFCTYSVRDESNLPKLPGMPILDIAYARSLFDFKKGKLESIAK